MARSPSYLPNHSRGSNPEREEKPTRGYGGSLRDDPSWPVYFATIYGWQFHPGTTRDGYRTLTLEEAAEIADAMVIMQWQ
jgi:hypothetical protein